MPEGRYDFASDNTAGFCPAALEALREADHGRASSYGEDPWTQRACDRVREIFETDCDVFFVFNGTAANALALAQLCQPFHSILCHEHAHIENDECGACEMFAHGAKLILTRGENGKLDVREIEQALARQSVLHSHKPRALSLTQATELGTVYCAEEIAALSDFAKKRNLLLHMDGARFANAVASLSCRPADITWRVGVDVLCFGGTKNGLAAGELVVFFDRARSADFDYRLKQAGQLASKMRYLSAPWLALLENDLWLKNAAYANAAAHKLADAISPAGAKLAFPAEASAVFLHLSETIVQSLRDRGWRFYKFIEPDIYRLMCAWSTTDDAINAFTRDFRECCARAGNSL